MKKAMFYLYRNLSTGGFSIKHNGRVCARGHVVTMHNVEFRVNPGGSARAKEDRERNVHAFMVSADFEIPKVNANGLALLLAKADDMVEVTYNPFENESFVTKGTQEPITQAKYAIAVNGKVYVRI